MADDGTIQGPESTEAHDAEARYRRLFELMPLPSVVHDGHRIVLINRAATRWFGFSAPEEAIGRPVIDFVHPDDRARVAERVRLMMTGGIPAPPMPERFLRDDGEVLEGETIATPITLHGKPAIQVIIRDLSDRRAAEAAIEASQRRFAAVVLGSPMGVHLYELEADDRLMFVAGNPAADRILGIDHETLIGLSIDEAFPSLAETEIPAIYRRIALNGGRWDTRQVAYEDDRVSGAYEVHAFQTEPGSVAVMFFDVTDAVRREADSSA